MNHTEAIQESTIYICEKCHSSDVENKYWCKVNTGKIVEVDYSSKVWCCQCEEETTLKEK